jgi:heme-degrading monooxygenase HmoA
MTVIKINALTVPAEMGEEVARRFAARAGAVDGQEGFEGFELLRPTDERTTWLVVTRWRDQQSFDAWRTSPSFAHGHRPETSSESGSESGSHASAGNAEAPAEPARPPLPIQAELWSYEVATASE